MNIYPEGRYIDHTCEDLSGGTMRRGCRVLVPENLEPLPPGIDTSTIFSTRLRTELGATPPSPGFHEVLEILPAGVWLPDTSVCVVATRSGKLGKLSRRAICLGSQLELQGSGGSGLGDYAPVLGFTL